MKPKAVLALLCLGLTFLCSRLDCGSESTPYPPGLYAELFTSKGTIVLRLDFQKTPLTVANFAGLAEGTIANKALPKGTPYFDGSPFHRVVPGHVIQAGRPGGSDQEGPGYEIPNEIRPELRHSRAGILGMANSGPHTAGSQFYITLAERSYLDGDYAVFGEVVSGMDVVMRIAQGDVIEKVTIIRSGRRARRFRADDAVFRRMADEVKANVAQLEKEKKEREESLIRRKWPAAVELRPGLRSLILQEGGAVPAAGSTLHVRYRGQFLDGRSFVSLEGGRPGWGEEPAVFTFVLGTSAVNPGIDQILKQMKAGEKRLLILYPEVAYGRSGFYGRSEPGKSRFVISPNTTLVYEIEVAGVSSPAE